MQNFKLNEEFLLNNQDWTFPTFTAYGPGRFKEIGKFCKNFKINNIAAVPPKTPVIVIKKKSLKSLISTCPVVTKNNIKPPMTLNINVYN